MQGICAPRRWHCSCAVAVPYVSRSKHSAKALARCETQWPSWFSVKSEVRNGNDGHIQAGMEQGHHSCGAWRCRRHGCPSVQHWCRSLAMVGPEIPKYQSSMGTGIEKKIVYRRRALPNHGDEWSVYRHLHLIIGAIQDGRLVEKDVVPSVGIPAH